VIRGTTEIPKAELSNTPTEQNPPTQIEPSTPLPLGKKPVPLPDVPENLLANQPTQKVIYRSLTQVVSENEREAGRVSDLEWASLRTPEFPQKTKLPQPVMQPAMGSTMNTNVHEVFDTPASIAHGSSDVLLTMVPGPNWWLPPLAQQRAPRTYAKYLNDQESAFDVAVGSQFSLFRLSRCECSDQGLQLEIFGAGFSRFGGNREFDVLDVRFGIPLVYSLGNTQFKLAYEHSSSHGRQAIDTEYRRHDIVFGLSHWWCNRVRAYGEIAGALEMGPNQGDNRMRYGTGIEWIPRRCTPWYGSLFAAADLDVRGEQDHEPNVTLQLGWTWRTAVAGRGPRVAAEYYRGKNPFGQYFLTDSDWIGVVTSWDW
jgi:hypothetical protein